MNYNRINNITGWLVFALSFITYVLTVSPTGSFWDCGEFAAVSNELEVPHPPGAPLYLLLGRIFAIFAFGNVENIAFMINMLSVISSAFTSLFTCWIITMLGKKLIAPNNDNPDSGTTYALMFAGLVGGMTCTFCDSIWFNAVEAEVYAISSFFTAVVVWLMLKWEARADEPDNLRWILLIAYVMGLSVGVHLLNLLTIPALGMIYYFRKNKFTWVGFSTAMLISVVILGLINSGMIKYTFSFAWNFEQFFTGTYNLATEKETGLGLPFGTGSMIFTILFVGSILGGIYYSHLKKIVWLNTALLGTVMVYLGISSYALILIRSKADPPINENNPSNLLNYLSYMKREQYGDWPILRGPMYNAEPVGYKSDPKPSYYKFNSEQKASDWANQSVEKLNKKYVIYDERPEYDYGNGERFFPRMHSSQHYTGKGGYSYINYVKNKGGDPANPSDDEPSGLDNIKFFWDYQLSYMYVRYFLWNFVGRQGDEQGRVDDWESGLKPTSSSMPEYMKNDPSRNHYYFLPLILGILGLAWQYSRSKKDAAVVGALFFFTGLAIILYLNQTPMQPRERDYSYAGSFQTYCIWVGLGVLGLWELTQRILKNSQTSAIASGVVSFALVPGLMGAVNWHDHSRAGNYMAPDSAYNMLMSCEKNAILFTNGDNDTFPLWYLQEVEGVRTDVRIVNLSLLNTDWYIHQLKMQCNDSPPLSITYTEKDYMGEKNGMAPAPASKVEILPVDVQGLLASKAIALKDTAMIEAPMRWEIKAKGSGRNTYHLKQDLLIIDLVKNIAKEGWKRPIYFAITVPSSSFVNLSPYFQLEGMAYRILPVKDVRQRGNERINLDKMYDLQLKTYRLRGLDDPNVFYASDIKRMVGNLRYNYIRLATAYLESADEIESKTRQLEADAADGKKGNVAAEIEANKALIANHRKKATEVIDFCYKKISDKAVRIEPYYLAQYARVYATGGNMSMGKQLTNKAVNDLIEDYTYDYENGGDEDQTGSYVQGMYSLLELTKEQLKDPVLGRKIADGFFSMLSKNLTRILADPTRDHNNEIRESGYFWMTLANYYKDVLKDKKNAENVGSTFKQLTGSGELLDMINGVQRQRPSREEIEAMQAEEAAQQQQQAPAPGADVPTINIPQN